MIVSENDNAKQVRRRMFERMGCNFEVEIYNPVMYLSENARVCDFSGGGLGLLSKRAFPLNDEVELKIYFSKESAEPILHKAQVIWARYQDSGLWRIGLRFFGFRFGKLISLMN